MRIVDRLMHWESSAELIGVLIGLGVLSYIGATWMLAFWSQGRYVVAAAVVLAALVLAILALARMPLALMLVFGGAAVSIAAFVSGHLNLFLP